MEGGRIARELTEQADTLAMTVVDWYRTIGETERWLSLPPDLGQDHLPDLIVALVEATLKSDFDGPACRALVEMAARHGEDRRVDGFEERLVFTEYHLLRRALWELLQAHLDDPGSSFDATIRLDEGIGLATAASLYGYHRPEFEETGRWPQVLRDLLESWPGYGGGGGSS